MLFASLNLIFWFNSDAWRRRRRRRRSGKMDEGSDVTVTSQDNGEEIPVNAKEMVYAALQDLEAQDEAEEYDLHPKHAI